MVYGVCTLAVLIDSCYQQSLSEVGVSLGRPYPKLLTIFLELFFFKLCLNILAILPVFKIMKV